MRTAAAAGKTAAAGRAAAGTAAVSAAAGTAGTAAAAIGIDTGIDSDPTGAAASTARSIPSTADMNPTSTADTADTSAGTGTAITGLLFLTVTRFIRQIRFTKSKNDTAGRSAATAANASRRITTAAAGRPQT